MRESIPHINLTINGDIHETRRRREFRQDIRSGPRGVARGLEVILFLAQAIGDREASATEGTVAERTAPVGKVKVAGAGETTAPAPTATPGDRAGTPHPAPPAAAAQAPLETAQAEEPG